METAIAKKGSAELAASVRPGKTPAAVQHAFEKASSGAIMMSPEMINAIESMAQLMAGSKCTMPTHLQGNVPDCFAVAMQALQWGMNPFAVAQKTYLVGGKLGYEAQLVASALVSTGAVEPDIDYEWHGDWDKVVGKTNPVQVERSAGVKVSATIKSNGKRKTCDVCMAQAKIRNSTNWENNPKQQLAYFAIRCWARLFAPWVILGVYTPDELPSVETVGQAPAHYGEIVPIAPAVVEEPKKVEAPKVNEEKPAPKARPGCIDAEQWKTLCGAYKKGKASQEKFLSGLRLFFGVEDHTSIKIEQLPDLITWALNGCNEPSAASAEPSSPVGADAPFEFNDCDEDGKEA